MSKLGKIKLWVPLWLYEFSFKLPPLLLFRQKSTKIIIKALKEINPKELCVVGSSTGYIFPYLVKIIKNHNITFFDVDNKMIKFARKRFKNAKFIKKNFFEINEKFENILLLMAEYERAKDIIMHLKEILKKDGIALIKVQAPTLFAKIVAKTSLLLWQKPVFLFKPQDYLKLLKENGFMSEWKLISSFEGTYLIITKRQ